MNDTNCMKEIYLTTEDKQNEYTFFNSNHCSESCDSVSNFKLGCFYWSMILKMCSCILFRAHMAHMVQKKDSQSFKLEKLKYQLMFLCRGHSHALRNGLISCFFSELLLRLFSSFLIFCNFFIIILFRSKKF